MYSCCIFCSHQLGANEALETFPVGRLIAFDAWKGRLWAICPACGRWNLAPIEERWEAIEDGERRFRETKLRVQAENIGIAELPDGTRLVRVGEALPGELAAWRYGTELRQRRRTFRREQVLRAVATALMPEASLLMIRSRRREVVYVRPAAAGFAKRVLIRERDLSGARVEVGGAGGLAVTLTPRLSLARRVLTARSMADTVEFRGRQAGDLLARALVRVNAAGAAERELRRARETVERLDSAERLVADALGGTMMLAERRWSLSRRLQGRMGDGTHGDRVPGPTLLALEMLLHEESERRALAGELEALREQWRQAEEIAAIVDTLLVPSLDPLQGLAT